jgi:hypothetical protein
LRRRQGLFAAAESGQPVGESVQPPGQIGRERVGARPRQRAKKIGCLLRRRQSLLVATEFEQHKGEIVQRHGQIWRERLGARLRQGLLLPPEFGQPVGEIVQRTGQIWRERLGARLRQRAKKIGRLLGRRQGLLAAANAER